MKSDQNIRQSDQLIKEELIVFYIIIFALLAIALYTNRQWVKMRDLANDNANAANYNREIILRCSDLIGKLDEQIQSGFVNTAEVCQFMYKVGAVEATMSDLLYKSPNKRQQAIDWLKLLETTKDLSWLLDDICVQVGVSRQKLHNNSNTKRLVLSFLETTSIDMQIDNSQTMRRFTEDQNKRHTESDVLMNDVLNIKEQLGLIK